MLLLCRHTLRWWLWCYRDEFTVILFNAFSISCGYLATIIHFQFSFSLHISNSADSKFYQLVTLPKKQISYYVFVTTLSYSACYVTGTTLFVLAEIGLDTREWVLIPNHLNNLRSILALYICFKEYRNKVKHCCILLSVWRPTSRIRAHPIEIGNSSV